MYQQPTQSIPQTIPTVQPTTTSSLPQQAADIAVGAATHAAQTTAIKAQNLTYRTTSRLRNIACWVTDTFRVYAMRYPPIAAFFITLMVTSSFPLIAFLTFAGMSLSALSTVAIAVVGTIESGLLAVAGTMLGFVLVGCTIVSFVGAGLMTMIYLGLAIGRWMFRSAGGLYYSSTPVYGSYASGAGQGWYAAGSGSEYPVTGGMAGGQQSSMPSTASGVLPSLAEKAQYLRQKGENVRESVGAGNAGM